MGFAQGKTTHHFLLSATGGAIQVETNDPADQTSRDLIRTHLKEIASEFGKGVFVQVKYHNERPNHYKFEIGANICPEVWYEDAMASVNWS